MISFIWMGNLDSDIKKTCCQLGPKSLATLDSSREITLWVPETLLAEAGQLFSDYPNIQVKSVDRMLKGEYGALKHIDSQVDRIKHLLSDMEKTKSYVAQKDLLSFAIMTEFGGYFFDCTTKFDASAQLPPVKDFKMTLPKPCQNMEEGTMPLYGSDIWAFAAASRPNHALFRDTLNETLATYLDGAISWEDIHTGISARDFAFSLNKHYKDEVTVPWLKEHSWVDVNSETGHYLPELGLEKFNTGFWRRDDGVMPIAHGVNNLNFKAFQKLGLLETQNQELTPNLHSDINKHKYFAPEEKKDYLYFKTLSGEIVKVDKALLSSHSTIAELKSQIAEQLHLEKDMTVKILFAGKSFDDLNEILSLPGNDEKDPFFLVPYRGMPSRPLV